MIKIPKYLVVSGILLIFVGILTENNCDMRRLLLSLLGIVVSVFAANAGKVTEQQALQKAQQLLGGKSVVAVESHKTLTRSLGDAPAFYIFNARDNEGFVIVSADDRTEAVLGYSYHGTFSLDDTPDILR